LQYVVLSKNAQQNQVLTLENNELKTTKGDIGNLKQNFRIHGDGTLACSPDGPETNKCLCLDDAGKFRVDW